jgi:hypothetical protein
MDYVDWERFHSYPNGTLSGDDPVTKYPDAAGVGRELFTDRTNPTTGRLPNHARARLKDVRRIEFTGQLTISRWNPSIEPGQQVYVEGGGITPVGVVRSITFDSNQQTQTLELCAADARQIYDVPIGGSYATSTPPEPAEKPYRQGPQSGETPKGGGEVPKYPAGKAPESWSDTPAGRGLKPGQVVDDEASPTERRDSRYGTLSPQEDLVRSLREHYDPNAPEPMEPMAQMGVEDPESAARRQTMPGGKYALREPGQDQHLPRDVDHPRADLTPEEQGRSDAREHIARKLGVSSDALPKPPPPEPAGPDEWTIAER